MLGAAETRALADEMIGSFGPYDDAWGDARLGSPSRASSTAPRMPSRKSAFAGRKAKPSVSIHEPVALLFWCGFCQKRQMTERQFPPPWSVEDIGAAPPTPTRC